jgi:hypothetical protein
MEVRIATPFIKGIEWVVHGPIIESVPVQATNGQMSFQNIKRDEGLNLIITPYIGTAKLVDEVHALSKEELDVILAALPVNVEQSWSDALSEMADVFDVLKEPTEQELTLGSKYYIRLDSWRAYFSPEGSGSAVFAILGCYSDPAFQNIKGYIELQFGDNYLKTQKDNNIAAFQDHITKAEAVLQNEEATNEELINANNVKNYYAVELSRLQNQYFAQLGDLLALNSVKISVGALIGGIMSYLKISKPETYGSLDVSAFLTNFSARFESFI